MKIHGRECGFRFTVGASIEMAEMCPEKDLSRLEEIFNDGSYKNMAVMVAKMAAILSKANEEAVSYEGSRKPEKPLTEGEVLSLTQEEFTAVQTEVFKAYGGDSKRTVETEPPKKKEAKKKKTEKSN